MTLDDESGVPASPRLSLWRRLLAWLRGRSARKALPPAPGGVSALGDDAPAPAFLRPEEETWLETLAADVGEGQRLSELATGAFWQRIDALWKRGHERLATEWLAKLVAAPNAPPAVVVALRARLVELHEQRRDLGPALVHLDALIAEPDHAVRAHYLLAEHHRRRGDEVLAIRHYEAVLARDMTYPNVRRRLDRLRRLRGAAAPAAMGDTIAGVDAVGHAAGSRYRLVRELGRGATGVVYLARDTELERDVAIKLLHPHLQSSRQAAACARFFEEARISASLRHPNILAVLDMDERARRIVMELCAGGTLRHVLRDRGPRPLRRALERHAQLLSALAAGHRRGVIHRDVKPGNLMFRRDPDARGAEIVLGDFGVAHLPAVGGETPDALARAGGPSGPGPAGERLAEIVGTLAYMAPEQRLGVADPRSDLYAAAVVLYEMLTGRTPWSREQVLSGHRTAGDLALPPAVTADTPADLADGLRDHLARLGHPDPEQRLHTEDALAQARALRDIAIAAVGPSSDR